MQIKKRRAVKINFFMPIASICGNRYRITQCEPGAELQSKRTSGVRLLEQLNVCAITSTPNRRAILLILSQLSSRIVSCARLKA